MTEPGMGVSQHAGDESQATFRALARVGAIAAPTGALLLLVSTMLHPSGSHPNDPHAAFAEYAADSLWVWSHIGQFLGFAGLAIALGALATTFEAGRPAAWGRIGLGGAIAILTLAAALQAVDGVALKVMVDRWAAATGEAQSAAFESAFAVRQIEVGLASFLSLVTGLTVIAYSLAIVSSRRYPVWLGGVGLLGGALVLAGGLAQATTGFSDLAMMLALPSSAVLLIWTVLAGVLMWRLAARLPADDGPVRNRGGERNHR